MATVETLSPTGRGVLRLPNLRRYMAARSMTVLATEMQSVAVGWQVYDLTHDPMALGIVGLAQFLPAFLRWESQDLFVPFQSGLYPQPSAVCGRPALRAVSAKVGQHGHDTAS